MLESFRGWKRKVGCVTLVLACVFAVGWVRSFGTQDTLTVRLNPSAHHKLISVSGRLLVMTLSIDGGPIAIVHHWTVRPTEENRFSYEVWFPDSSGTITKDHLSMAFWSSGTDGGAFYDSTIAVKWYQFPYWSIVLPLTAISAWLLLSKPRAMTKPPITPASENS